MEIKKILEIISLSAVAIWLIIKFLRNIPKGLQFISDLLKTLWLFIGGIIAVGAIYFLLTGVDQGVDVVIQCGEHIWPGLATMVAVVLWSFLVWYSCRLLSYAKQKAGTTIPPFIFQIIPRLLAYNCFVCVQLAIFNLPTFYHLSLLGFLIFIGIHNGFYYLLHQWFTNKKKYAMISGWAFIAVFSLFYLYLAYINAGYRLNPNDYKRHMFWLPLVGLSMFALQVCMVYFFINRRKHIDTMSNTRSDFASQEANYIKGFKIAALVSLIIYCAAIINIKVSDEMGPLAFLLLALGVLVSYSNLISSWSIRLKINLFLFIYLLAIIMGTFGDPYKLRTLEPLSKSFYSSRPTVKQYVHKWVQKREGLLDKYLSKKDTFGVYFVLSDGGASRAGNWVCSVLSSLQDSSAKKDANNTFSDHLLAIAGASGGSVGNATFYGMLRARQEGLLKDDLSPHTAKFFNSDFLTFTLARLLGPDFFRHLVPTRLMMDRGGALETVLAEGSGDNIIDPQFDSPLSKVFDTSGTLPVFFITTTRVQDGMPSIMSSVQLPTYSMRFDFTHLLDTLGEDIRFSTAAILSSRFPYVSPAGGIKNNYFVDGGYVDNTGAGIMADFLEDVETIFNDSTDTLVKKYKDYMTFHVIHIYNSPITDPHFAEIKPLTNDILTPILALAGMQGSSTAISTGSLEAHFKEFNKDPATAIINYGLYDTTKKDEESYPMSWVISCYQLERMHLRLIDANNGNKSSFWFLKQGK